MDPWLNDRIKETLIRPCLAVTGHIGRRLDARFAIGQEIDERALTEDVVDRFDTSLPENVWGTALTELREQQIYLSTSIRKSTVEHRTGADIGFILNRSNYTVARSHIEYAALVQCKRVDQRGNIQDFYHEVAGSKRRQSELMLAITPSSFYFLFTPPALVRHYCSVEPLAFLQAAPGCSVPAWNLGLFEHDGLSVPFLTAASKAEVAGILVVPALAVQAQQPSGRSANLQTVLPNCVPFWYWFAQLFVPGFVGDQSPQTIAAARNVRTHERTEGEFGVQYSVQISVGNG